MQMTLRNFDEFIDPKIIERGRKYFRNGAVDSLVDEGGGQWSAIVIGSEYYEVEVLISSDGTILSSTCDCPYDWGAICKHETAVFYALRDQWNEGVALTKGKSQKAALRDVLEKLSQTQLIDIIIEQAKKNKTLADQIRLRYGEEAPGKTQYIRMIQNEIRAYSDQGFLGYMESRRAAKPVYNLLDQAQSAINNNEIDRALPIIQAVIETMPEIVAQADDSDGELGGTTQVAFNLLEEAQPEMTTMQKAMLFDYLLTEAPHKKYGYFDDYYLMLDQLAALAETTDQRQRLLTYLDAQLGNQAQSGYSISHYREEYCLRVRVDVMEAGGATSEAVETLLQQFINLHRSRKMLIKRLMARNAFAEASKLVTRGIIQAEKERLPGLVSDYRKLLLEIAQQTEDTRSAIEIATELMLDMRDFEKYYALLGELVPKSEWKPFIAEVIGKLKKQVSGWGRNQILGDLYVREEMWDDLLQLAQGSPLSTVERYRRPLEKHFPEIMCQLYEGTVRSMLEHTGNRQIYQEACVYLKRIIEIGQPERAAEIADELKQQYPKRKAMIEELNRIA